MSFWFFPWPPFQVNNKNWNDRNEFYIPQISNHPDKRQRPASWRAGYIHLRVNSPALHSDVWTAGLDFLSFRVGWKRGVYIILPLILFLLWKPSQIWRHPQKSSPFPFSQKSQTPSSHTFRDPAFQVTFLGLFLHLLQSEIYIKKSQVLLSLVKGPSLLLTASSGEDTFPFPVLSQVTFKELISTFYDEVETWSWSNRNFPLTSSFARIS